MSGVGITVDASGINVAIRAMEKLADPRKVTEAVAGIVASGAKLRIGDLKKSPEGIAWPAWSDKYAKSRHGNQSLLVSGDDPGSGLLDDIHDEIVSDTAAKIGSELEYAASHQFGDDRTDKRGRPRNIPKREFLGISDADEKAIVEEIDAWLDEAMS